MDTVRIKLEEFQISPEFRVPTSKILKAKKPDHCDGKTEIIKLDSTDLEIDFIGFHTSLVNAYRRIILAEVPTVGIEMVFMYNNSSIVQDEVLAHRLGLIPLNVDPRFFEFRTKDTKDYGPQDTVKYKLKVKCAKDDNVKSQSTLNADFLYKHRQVFSSDLEWIPIGNQSDIFSAKSLGPLYRDILLAKMNPGHEIDLEAYAVKGTGSDHAKFQPGISWYRLLPEIELTREVEGEEAHILQRCFTPGVISLVRNDEGKTVAEVNEARYDSCSRNIYQYENLKDAVKLTRNMDHIIFHVESQSFLKSHEILEEAVSIMISKCNMLLIELNKYLEDDGKDE